MGKKWEAALMADALLEIKKAKLRKLKEMTAPRRMDVRVTDVFCKVAKLNKSVMEIVDAGMAEDALMMMNRLTKMMSGSQKKSTQVMYKLMTVPKDSFVLPFRTDFIS